MKTLCIKEREERSLKTVIPVEQNGVKDSLFLLLLFIFFNIYMVAKYV